jgi:hypothetical protein
VGDAVIVLDEQDDWSGFLHPGVSIHNATISFASLSAVTW